MIACLAGLALASSAAPHVDQPNILVLVADDMTWSDCEPYGSTQVHTPNMQRLANEGLCFDQMFTATAMCSPTRQQLMTGLFPVRNGAYPNHSWVYEGVKGIPHHLAELGYRVGMVGKSHIGPRESFPFERLGNNSLNFDKAEAFITRDKDQPYCLFVTSSSPHQPWDRGSADLYPPDEIKVPANLIDADITRETLSKYFAEITDLDRELGSCLDVVEETGEADNTIVIFTSEQGMAYPFGGKWTCYDSGLKTSFIVRWPKVVEPGTRTEALSQYVDLVPTLIEAAGGDPDDFDPGRPDAQGNESFDGRSLLSVWRGELAEHRDHVFGVHTSNGILHGSLYPIRSVRSKRFKYIQNLNHTEEFHNVYTRRTGEGGTEGKYYESITEPLKNQADKDPESAARLRFHQRRPAEELYDLERDPFELNNLADAPEHEALQAELRAELDKWMKQQGDGGMETEKATRKRAASSTR